MTLAFLVGLLAGVLCFWMVVYWIWIQQRHEIVWRLEAIANNLDSTDRDRPTLAIRAGQSANDLRRLARKLTQGERL